MPWDLLGILYIVCALMCAVGFYKFVYFLSIGYGFAVAGGGLAPEGVVSGRLPDGLGVGTNENLISPALQFFAFRAVYKLKILPFICNPHNNSPNKYS